MLMFLFLILYSYIFGNIIQTYAQNGFNLINFYSLNGICNGDSEVKMRTRVQTMNLRVGTF